MPTNDDPHVILHFMQRLNDQQAREIDRLIHLVEIQNKIIHGLACPALFIKGDKPNHAFN